MFKRFYLLRVTVIMLFKFVYFVLYSALSMLLDKYVL